MKKITLFVFAFLAFTLSAISQHSFPAVAGPTNVLNGSPVTLNINDTGNSAAVPVSSTGSYGSFSISTDWIAGGGNPYSSEADLTINTTGSSVLIDPATTGSAFSGAATTLTFDGDFTTPYDPTTDGVLDLILNQSYAGSDGDWSNIVVTIFESPSCIAPSGMDAANTTLTGTDLTWTMGDAETAWNLEWNAAADFTPGNGEESGSANPSGTPAYSPSGLTAQTTYFVYYQASCGGTDTSEWVGPFTFLTGYCDSIPTSNDDQGILSIVAGSTTLTSAGDVTYEDFTGTTVNLSQSVLANLLITFATGYTYDTNIWIDFNNDLVFDNITELVFQGASLADNPTTLDASFLMPAVPLGTYRMRITTHDFTQTPANPCYSGAYGVTADLTINVTDPPACIPPTDLMVENVADTTADVSWTANNGETAWEIATQPAGTGVPTGNGDAIATNPYTSTGLTAATDYEVYVRANCGGDYSDWVGPVNFTTECTFFVAPYVEDFENAGTIPNCWSMSGGEDWLFSDDPGFNHIGNNGVITGATASGGFFAWVDDSGTAPNDVTLLSPLVDVSGLTTPALSFYELSDNEGNTNATLTVEVWDGAAWNTVGTYNTNTGGWQLIIINLDTLTITGNVQARFTIAGSVDFYDDIAIDDVRLDEAPACIPPGALAVSGIAGTTADVSWTANNGETEWQYVVQPAGTGIPTADGIVVNATTVNLTGLDYSTDYEVYVRANCGAGGLSDWVGPVNFSTTIQTDYIVDCTGDSGPVNVTLCYDSNESLFWHFTSSDGSPLRLVFNTGNVEGNFDFIYAYDGVDNTAPELFNSDTAFTGFGAFDLTGLQINTTGPDLYVEFTSDGSVSCQSSDTYTSWDFDVTCATCINPEANYLVVDDCENGDQFLIDVDITSFGDGTSMTISDNMMSTPVQVSELGITTFGPYPFLTDIIITIENDDDSNCIINSGPIQQAACPPDNDNPCDAIVAVVNDNESCDQVNAGTLLAASDSGVPTGSCGGNPDDDVWFEFVALSEVQLISILNIQGSTTNLDHGLYEGTCDGLVELYCSDDDASVTTQLVIGNTYFVRVFSGGTNEETSTFDLCIKEAPDNIICENASNFCSDGDALYGANIIGIPDATDVACLGSIPNPSWNTIQIGESGPINIQISQATDFDDAGNPVGTGLDVDFVLWGPFDNDTDFCELDLLSDCPTCPNNTTSPDFYPFGNIVDCSYSFISVETVTIDNALEGEIYVLLVTNFSDQPGVIQIQQTNATDPGAGGITAEIEVDLGADQDLCGFPDYTIVADSPYADTYEWYQNGIYMPDETGDSITVTESDTYTVIAYNEQCDTNAQDEVTINFYQDANANAVVDMVTCDDASADEIEDFDLETQTAGILGTQDSMEFVVTYYTSLADAQSATGALTSPYNNTSNPQTIYYRIEDVDAVGTSSGCFATSSFDLVISGPLPSATSVNIELCDDYSRDGVESFDLDAHSVNVLDGQDASMFDVSYYVSQTDADAGMNPLMSPYDNISNPQTIYARVENNTAFDCYSTTGFDLIVGDVPFTTFDSSIVYEVCPNATIPIEVEANPENYAVSDVAINWYNEGVLMPGENSLIIPVLTEGTYTIEVTSNSSGCVYQEDVLVLEYESCVIPQVITPNGDPYNNEFDLSSYDVHQLEIYNRNGKLVYSKDNYSNEWVGQTDAGDQLPVGTYFYVMRYQDNKEKTGWIYLNY